MTIERISNFPEKTDADKAALAAFYREPLERKRQNAKYREEVLDPVFETIDLEQLEAVKQGSRERGVYERELRNFEKQELTAGKVSLSEGAFQGKTYSTVLQGFRTALKKDEFKDRIRVIGKADEEGIYLFVTDEA